MNVAFAFFADMVVVLHLGFVLFVMLGGLLGLQWKWIMWIHLPAAMWGALIEFTGWICPLTPLENWLREAGERWTRFPEHLKPILKWNVAH